MKTSPLPCAIAWLVVFCGACGLLSLQSASAADWPMRGRDSTRNAVVPNGVGPTEWSISPKRRQNVRWSAQVGTVSTGDPVISDGLVWIGTNNGNSRDPSNKADAGVLMCFDERSGEFLYQYVSPRLPEGRFLDWPGSSLASSPLVERDHLWFCNNRCEVVCLNIGPLIARTGKPEVVWKVDLRGEFGIVPRPVMIGSNLSQCSIASYRGLIYINTMNSCGYDRKVPKPDAPSLVCLEMATGKLRWQDNSPGEHILDVQNGNPLVAEIKGHAQVIMGQGDGVLRGFDALDGKVLWSFDINVGSKGKTRAWNDCVPMPVLHDRRVYFTTGRHYEIPEGPGRMGCLDPTRVGDISSHVRNRDGEFVPNPNSGLIWDYVRSSDGSAPMGRTLSSVAVHAGLALASDTDGHLHCVDATTGAGLWVHNMMCPTMCSPLIVGDRVYAATDSLFIFRLARQKELIAEQSFPASIEASPVFCNGTLYVMTRDELFAIGDLKKSPSGILAPK